MVRLERLCVHQWTLPTSLRVSQTFGEKVDRPMQGILRHGIPPFEEVLGCATDVRLFAPAQVLFSFRYRSEWLGSRGLVY